jgi:hypothetical protein
MIKSEIIVKVLNDISNDIINIILTKLHEKGYKIVKATEKSKDKKFIPKTIHRKKVIEYNSEGFLLRIHEGVTIAAESVNSKKNHLIVVLRENKILTPGQLKPFKKKYFKYAN